MSKNPVKLKIAWLYPDILQGYCDRANIETFCKRALWRDIEVEVCEIKANDKVSSSRYDFYYIGGSNFEELDECIKYLSQNTKELQAAAKNNIPMLAVNCGYVLFGNSYQLNNKEEKEGISIFDIKSVESDTKHCGNVFGKCRILNNQIIAGYKNQDMISFLSSDCESFVELKKGFANSIKNKKEGAIHNNAIGTYITSPILAHNPHLCDFLIEAALKTKCQYRITLTPLCDDIEYYAHNYIVESK